MDKPFIRFTSYANIEFLEIVEFYQSFDEELSIGFFTDVEVAINLIKKFPKAGRPYLQNTRRILLNQYPFAMIYEVTNDTAIIIHTFMHLKRNPNYWKY